MKRLAAVLVAAALGVVGCGTSVLDLEVGQCVAEGATGGQVATVPVVDCAEPHVGEIYALPQLPDGAFPGNEAVTAQAEELCTGQAFQDYVGVPYLDSEIYYTTLAPSAETWADGDREIVCLLAMQDQSATTGTLRGAGR